MEIGQKCKCGRRLNGVGGRTGVNRKQGKLILRRRVLKDKVKKKMQDGRMNE